MTAIAAAAALLLAVVLGTADYFTPDSFTVAAGDRLKWLSGAFSVTDAAGREVTASTEASFPKTYRGKLMLYNMIPIKDVNINYVDQTCVIPCGTPFGIKMFTNGVVIVGLADIQTNAGASNPAKDAGLQVGDVVVSVNGKTVNTNSEVQDAVEHSGGKGLSLQIRRDSSTFQADLQPVRSNTDGLYKAGLWVRDSTAGIGTLTFYDPNTKCFAGLGHGICDSDTGELMPLLTGDIVPVTINGITKGLQGKPGELRGYFSSDNSIGNLDANISTGVYGSLQSAPAGSALKVAMKQDVKPGAAKIMTTIDGGKPKYYDAVIEKIDYRDNVQSKNLVIHITDKTLTTQTGGIVQGMSGSPILQNNMLVGAVTHVFVNDPTRGYGIFAESMLSSAQTVGSSVNSKAS